MHINLFCKVGRAEKQPIGTFEDSEYGNMCCDAVQQKKIAELLASGVNLNRVEFTRETAGSARKGK
jgi:hypothetical protein